MDKTFDKDIIEPLLPNAKKDHIGSSVLILQTDKCGTICFAEGNGLASDNLNLRELIGLSIFDVFKDFSIITDTVKICLNGQSTRKHIEYKGINFDVTFAPIKGFDGNISGVVCLAVDITEIKNTHEALVLSEARYRMLIENTSDIMFIMNNKGIFTYISSSVKRFGYEVEDIVGKNVAEFIHEEDRMFTVNEIQNSFKGITGQAPRTFRIILKNGSYIIVEETGTVVRDNNGNITHLTGILRDVTERNLAEEQLRKNEERYRLLVELMPESVIVLQDNEIAFVNSSFIQLCNLKYQEEAIGKNIFDFIHPEYIDILRNVSENILNNKLKGMSFESIIITSENKPVNVEIMGSYFIYTDNPSIIFIITDISERQKNKLLSEKIKQNNMLLSEAREYDKLKTEFFSNISHEFKTPLSVILGTIQLLNLIVSKKQDGNLIKFSKYFSVIKQNCYRLIRLVNNFIDITKIDSNYYDIKLQNKNIVNIVENIVLSIADYVENQGLLIEFIKAENEIICACDPDKIERIMLNLISNAIKFTPLDGKITVKIERNNGYVQISVIDTGIGIPSDKLNFIFERFRQIDKSMSRSCEGSGIGLSLVKSLVEMHDGSVFVKSKLGEGSEFVINIPIRLVTNEERQFIYNDKRIKEMQIERINIEFSDIYNK